MSYNGYVTDRPHIFIELKNIWHNEDDLLELKRLVDASLENIRNIKKEVIKNG